MKLASLFDGISGFPHAGSMLGIEPIWASEIEKAPIAVSKHHFPNMKHYGDITKINGAEVEPVDIITFGSPCQDLSVAGKRVGMAEGTRSGLFSEAVRIIKEMRDGTNETYPRYAVWENVPGAFSSNHGEDFRAVIESLAQVAETAVSIPLPKDGKWEPTGLVEGDTWSIAWRTLDAQFWGVPQRRKRIFLVADFGGQRASEIFFERKSVSGDIAESGSQRQEVTGGVEGGVRATGCFHPNQSAKTRSISHAEDQAPTLQADSAIPAVYPITCATKQQAQSIGFDIANPIASCDYKEPQIVLFEPRSQDGIPRIHETGVCPTLNTAEGGQRQPCVCVHATQDPITAENRSHALGANSSQAVFNQQKDAVYQEKDIASTLSHREDIDTLINQNSTVRRLTPLECERLQGFQDGWTNIGLSDSARYKALGNSVAIPCVKFILSCIVRESTTPMSVIINSIMNTPINSKKLNNIVTKSSEGLI